VATTATATATATARSAAVTAFGMCDRNIDQADAKRHRESRHPYDRQNGDPPFPAHSGSHPIPLKNIDLQAGHLIAAQAQVAPTLWRQTSTLRNEWK
jgi:hypothetical protein